MISFAKEIRAIRKGMHLSQTALAMRAGVSHVTICAIEREKRTPSVYMAQTLLDAMGYELRIVKKGAR